MIETVKKILRKVDVNVECYAGSILEIATVVASPEDAIRAIRDFCSESGVGWLRSSEHQPLLLFPGDLALLEEVRFPICGEFVKGSESLHLRQDGGGGWIISRLTEEQGGDGMIREVAHLRRDGQGSLRYRVVFQPQEVRTHECAHMELRPFVCRFAGFVATGF